MRVTYTARLIPLQPITLIMLAEEYKLWSSPLCPSTLVLPRLPCVLCTLFSDILSACRLSMVGNPLQSHASSQATCSPPWKPQISDHQFVLTESLKHIHIKHQINNDLIFVCLNKTREDTELNSNKCFPTLICFYFMNVVVEWLALMLYIWKIPLSNLGLGPAMLMGFVVSFNSFTKIPCKKLKQSRYTPWRRLGERRYSSSFTTSALDGGEWSASCPGCALPPGKWPPVPIEQEAGWAPEPVWTDARGKILLPLPGIKPQSPGHPVRSQALYWLSYPGSR
jgi:hypothetical protein